MQAQEDFDCLAIDKEVSAFSAPVQKEAEEVVRALSRSSSTESLCGSDDGCMSENLTTDVANEQILLLVSWTNTAPSAHTARHMSWQNAGGCENDLLPPPRRFSRRLWVGFCNRLVERSRAARLSLDSHSMQCK